jgi:superfamily II DNA/RNA helicase
MPETRQTVLFSATLPQSIRAIAERHLRDPQREDPDQDPDRYRDRTGSPVGSR